jgi:hypothetical protein
MADELENQANQEAGQRTGGNMQTKSGSQSPPPNENSDTRAGGNMQTKGASHRTPEGQTLSKAGAETNDEAQTAGEDRQ